MALFAKAPNEIINEATDFMLANTPINSITSGSKFRALLEILKNQLAGAYATFDYNIAIGFIYSATGQYLDFLGDVFGIKRLRAATASASSLVSTVKFYVIQEKTFGDINSGADYTIAGGTKVFAIRGGETLEYSVLESITADKASTEVYASIQALTSGSKYNVPAGAITTHNLGIDTVRVINVNPIDSGVDAESDENYRYRLINGKLTTAQANITALRLASLSIPGVADVMIQDGAYGIGSVGVMVKSTTPEVSNETLTSVQYVLESVKAAGIKVMAIAPKYARANFTIRPAFKSNITETERSIAKDSIESALNEYVNNLDIGEPMYIKSLTSVVLGSHPKILSIGNNNRFFDDITINKELAVGKSVAHKILSDYYPTTTEKLLFESASII